MEHKRRCGWIRAAVKPEERIVWTRAGHSLTECPKPFITASSLSLLEAFSVWKLMGAGEFESMPARWVDAFWILARELRRQETNVRE